LCMASCSNPPRGRLSESRRQSRGRISSISRHGLSVLRAPFTDASPSRNA
jgi:hypothetical protein